MCARNVRVRVCVGNLGTERELGNYGRWGRRQVRTNWERWGKSASNGSWRGTWVGNERRGKARNGG